MIKNVADLRSHVDAAIATGDKRHLEALVYQSRTMAWSPHAKYAVREIRERAESALGYRVHDETMATDGRRMIARW